MTYTIQIRPRRKTTLPSPLLKKLGVDIGDSLEISIKGKKAIVKSKKQIALEAFRELQKIVQKSGVSEKEILKNAEKIREELYEQRTSRNIP